MKNEKSNSKDKSRDKRSGLYSQSFSACYFKVTITDLQNRYIWTAHCGSVCLLSTDTFLTREACVEDFEKLARNHCLCYEVTKGTLP